MSMSIMMMMITYKVVNGDRMGDAHLFGSLFFLYIFFSICFSLLFILHLSSSSSGDCCFYCTYYRCSPSWQTPETLQCAMSSAKRAGLWRIMYFVFLFTWHFRIRHWQSILWLYLFLFIAVVCSTQTLVRFSHLTFFKKFSIYKCFWIFIIIFISKNHLLNIVISEFNSWLLDWAISSKCLL